MSIYIFIKLITLQDFSLTHQPHLSKAPVEVTLVEYHILYVARCGESVEIPTLIC